MSNSLVCKNAILAVITLAITIGIVYSAENISNEEYSQSHIKTRSVVSKSSNAIVPAGEHISASLTDIISSESAYRGQKVILLIGDDYKYNNKVIAPKGSYISGTIIGLNNQDDSSEVSITIRFMQITTPSGLIIPISSIVKVNADDNKTIELPANSNLEITLTQPITLTEINYSYEY